MIYEEQNTQYETLNMSELACYAVSENLSLGRAFREKPHAYRSDFERDRDRIIHCEAFRRLEGKTQVFTPGLDDNYRNRLTHTIEVAQIGRTIAKSLSLNESLTEAICLAHDLGHPPFGHAGETILNDLTAEFGGFEHNRQSLRIVEFIEHPYPDFAGLNLMYETRLGLARHTSPYDKPGDETFSEQNCSLEGQIADIADRIAYNCHDLEDGMRAGLIDSEQLKNIKIFASVQSQINSQGIEDSSVRRTRAAKGIIDRLVSDCIEASKKAIARAELKTVEDVYAAGEKLIVLSSESDVILREMEEFLLEKFYLHKSLIETAAKVKQWLGELFKRLCSQPEVMPLHFKQLISQQSLERTVCDYIAGMTDRYCLKILKKEF